VPPFSDLIAATTRSAVHLELRDAYTPDDERLVRWLAGHPVPVPANPEWSALVREHKMRGVRFRRARVVSEPLADYIRFEHAVTNEVNVSAGEEVRWLPRRGATGICVPLNDFWLLDGKVVRFGYFAGNGEFLGDEVSTDPVVAGMCAQAFEAVWERAIPHGSYRPA
jgi:hypothetical protein